VGPFLGHNVDIIMKLYKIIKNGFILTGFIMCCTLLAEIRAENFQRRSVVVG
jgi:hypothetical protein